MKETERNNISRMVEAYFDCSLSVKEEKELGRMLAAVPQQDLLPDWEDALAALSLAAVGRTDREGHISGVTTKTKRGIFGKNAIPVLKVAASVAVLAVIGIVAMIGSKSSLEDGSCYAYVDGKLITDHKDISVLMDQQLSDMASAQESMMAAVNVDLSEMAAFMEENDANE